MQRFNQANIVLGNDSARDSILAMLLEDLSFVTKANPDFLLIENENFGIDDARALERWALGKSIGGPVKVAYIATKSVTFEAQNALLKLFEEPSDGTYLFLHLENLGNILPTFLSRIKVLKIGGQENNNIESKAHGFLNAGFKEKLAMINTMAKSDSKSDMKEILKDLEMAAYTSNNADTEGVKKMKAILKAKIFASARGASPKMLLEWLAVVL